jgi:hypothetical protein
MKHPIQSPATSFVLIFTLYAAADESLGLSTRNPDKSIVPAADHNADIYKKQSHEYTSNHGQNLL